MFIGRMYSQNLIISLVILGQLQGAWASSTICPYKICHLESKPRQKVRATLEYDIGSGLKSQVREWVVYTCIPPQLSRQSLISAMLKIKSSKIIAQKVCEESCLKRPVLRIHLSAGTQYLQCLPVRAEFSATLNETRLLAGAPQKPVPALSASERAHNLMPTYSLDYKSETFQNWLKANELFKRPSESDLDFAWRVFLCVKSKYRYFWSQSLDRRNSKVCLKYRADCAGLSYLYCGALRANGVPARPLIGRWARTSTEIEDNSNYFNCHVKSEFYASGIGWIPVDISQAVSNPHEDAKLFFGKDDGDFIVMHVNPDLVLDSIYQGLKNVRSMPDFRFWLLESGSSSQIPRRIIWKVSRL